MSAVPVPESERGWELCTDAKGEFRFETLRPGNYLLVVNPGGKIDDEQPFGKLYYPGVASKEHAALIGVVPGKYNLGIDLQLSQITQLIEITGRILFADDKPAKEVWVKFEPSDPGNFDRITARTDDDGRFMLKVPHGAAGVIRGSSYFSEYGYSKCQEIMTMVKMAGSSEISTTSLETDGTEHIVNATLRLPFNFCEGK